ncbi:hypothetical protein [Marinobacter sp.]|uniref:hypothetical protein n=1 Tax=Marinobacter sp. TaxID=50741 RepID=UPI003A8EE0D2
MSNSFMEQNRSLFSKFSEQIRGTPTVLVAVLAAAPAAAMIMGGAGLDSYEASQVLQNEGVEAYRALKASVGDMAPMEAIKTAMVGGFETVGRNVSMAGLAAAPALPALALIAKAAAHATEFLKQKFTGPENETKGSASSQLAAGLQGLNQSSASQSSLLSRGLEGLHSAVEQSDQRQSAKLRLG